jgi:hypothetical protein
MRNHVGYCNIVHEPAVCLHVQLNPVITILSITKLWNNTFLKPQFTSIIILCWLLQKYSLGPLKIVITGLDCDNKT